MNRKRAINVVDLIAAVREVAAEVEGRYIDNVYATSTGLLFRVRDRYVVADRHRFSLTGLIVERESEGLQTLRSLVRGERVERVYMPRMDRIVVVELGSGDRMIIELLEPMNAVVVRDGKVIWALHSYRGRDREVAPGKPYHYPPYTALDPFTELERLVEELSRAGVSERSVARLLGVGPEVAREAIARAGSTNPVDVVRAVRELIEVVARGELDPHVYYKSGQPITVTPLRYVSVEADRAERFDAFWKALDAYFVALEAAEAAEQRLAPIRAEEARLEASIAELRRRISEYEERAAELQRIARKLLEHKYEIESGSVELRPVGRGEAVVVIDGEEIRLRLGEPVGRQIKALFDEASELKAKAAKAREVLAQLEAKLAELRAREAQVAESVKPRRVVEKEWFERFRWFVTSRGTPVIGGKDAQQNEAIYAKYLKEHYLFFHADIPGAAAVVSPPISDDLEIYEVAQFAAAYSRGWKVGVHAMEVFYVEGRQVSKQAPSGQYLPKGSFMVRGERRWVTVRMELAVGVRVDGDVVRVVVAPPRAIRRLAERYVVVTPSHGEKSRTAREVARRLRREEPEVLNALLEALPGPANILEVGEGEPMSWEEVRAAFAKW